MCNSERARRRDGWAIWACGSLGKEFKSLGRPGEQVKHAGLVRPAEPQRVCEGANYEEVFAAAPDVIALSSVEFDFWY